jgi:hypothetical protein
MLGELPSWLDLQFAKTASGVLVIVALILLVLAIFMVRSIGVRVVIIVLLGASVVGLLHYRQQLDHCDKSGCECKFFGEDLKGGGCASAPGAQAR